MCAIAGVWFSASAAAQDSPLVRNLVTQAIREELVSHDSQDKSWYNEKSKRKESWTSGKLLGRRIRLASWTEESKSWVWLVDPDQNLHLELSQLEVRDARLHFTLKMITKARFKVWGRIPKLAKAAVGGIVQARIEIAGSAAVANGGLAESQITVFKAVLDDVQFNNDAAGPLEDLAKDALNDYVEDKNAKLRRTIEKAIDRVRFNKLPATKDPGTKDAGATAGISKGG